MKAKKQTIRIRREPAPLAERERQVFEVDRSADRLLYFSRCVKTLIEEYRCLKKRERNLMEELAGVRQDTAWMRQRIRQGITLCRAARHDYFTLFDFYRDKQ